ncbi:MAG: sigma-70 family RNA polymerase sigma factor [Phycisphaerae bacterium]
MAVFNSATHVTLLARLAGGADSVVWGEFLDRYGELIRGFARRQGLQASDCDDVLQEVLLALTRAIPGFEYDPAKGKFRSYLKTIALRAIYKKRGERHGNIDVSRIDEVSRAAANDEAVEQSWEGEWQQHHVRRAMRAIDAEFGAADRRAFQRYAVEGAEVGAVAAELGLSADQIYQAKSRIVRRLGELIEQQIGEEG